MSNKKQSSIDWLTQEIDNMISFIDIETSISFKRIVEQAKAMHKEDVEDAYLKGYTDNMNDEGDFEQYYTKTFGGQDNE